MLLKGSLRGAPGTVHALLMLFPASRSLAVPLLARGPTFMFQRIKAANSDSFILLRLFLSQQFIVLLPVFFSNIYSFYSNRKRVTFNKCWL